VRMSFLINDQSRYTYEIKDDHFNKDGAK